MNRLKLALSLGVAFLGVAAIGSASAAGPADRPATPSAYSAPALYDLGNFYARAGRPAMAVLNYERARVLAPTEPDVQKNLSHVRESLGLPAPHPGWLSQHDRLANPNTLYWIGILGLAITGVALLRRRVSSKQPALLAAGAVVGSLLMALGLCDAIATASTLHEYVVMAATAARTSPTSAVEPLFAVPLAEVVHVRDQHQGFALIRDSQGREGWVANADLAPVIPSIGNITGASTPPEAPR
jgi:hypothetical protein